MRSRYALLLLLLPSMVTAQSVTFTETVTGTGGLADGVINVAECLNASGGATSKLTFSWPAVSPAPTGGGTYVVEARDDVCSQANPPHKQQLSGNVTPDGNGGGSYTVTNVKTAIVTPLAVQCDATKTLYICVTWLSGSTGTANAQLKVDADAPNPPTITGVDPGDGALTPHWSQPSGGAADATSFTATASSGGNPVSSCTVTGGGSTSCRIAGLQNGTTYDVTVVAYSVTLNPSPASDPPAQGTPVPVDDFWRYYRKQLGQEEGGCGSGAAGLLALLLLVPLAPRLRRRRLAKGVAALALLLAAAPAWAGPSERWGSFQLQMGGYRPSIDSEFEGRPLGPTGPTSNTPYRDVFGTGRGWTFKGEFSRALFSRWGSLEMGIGVGWFSKSGRGFVQDTTTRAAEKTELRILPLSANLAYRFDYFVDRGGFPLVPYARASLERWQWWVMNGSGNTATSTTGGNSGSGATSGWSAGLGLSFLLDFLDPVLAREMDRDTGINHAYVFVEASRSRVNDFGSKKSWNLSDDAKVSWSFGLHFSF